MHHVSYYMFLKTKNIGQLEMWPMPNVLVALPNIGGAICSTPRSMAEAHYYIECRAVAIPRRETR